MGIFWFLVEKDGCVDFDWIVKEGFVVESGG